MAMVSSAQPQGTSAASGAVAPPTPQEITRKLSVHNRPAKPVIAHTLSGNESDSDSFSPEYSPLTGTHFTGGTAAAAAAHAIPQHGHGHSHSYSTSLGLSTSASSKPLSSIAERGAGLGDDESDEDDDQEGDEEWPHEPDHEQGQHHEQNFAAHSTRTDGESVIRSGYLLKKGERRKNWKKRWFVLRPAQISVYKSSAEYKLLRLLDLAEVHSCSPVTLKRHANSFALVYPTRTYYLQAQSEQDMQDWVKRVNETREVLLGTSTQNSMTSPIPIPVPISPGGSRHPHALAHALAHSPTATTFGGTITPSPPSARSIGFTGPVTSESDSEDQNAGEGQGQAPTNANTSPSKAKPAGAGGGAASMDPSKMVYSGYLMKCRSKRRGWRKRWFMLTGERLIYSASHMDTKRQRSIDLSQVIDALEYDLSNSATSPPVGLSGDDHAHMHPHEGDSANGPLGGSGSSGAQFTFKVVTTKRTLLLCAPSEAEEIKWLSTVRALIARRTSPPGAGSPSSVPGAPGGTVQALDSAVMGSGAGASGVKASASVGGRKRSASGASNLVLSRDEHQHH